MLVTSVTNGVKVSAESVFQSSHSDTENGHYLFSYRITIENTSSETIRLMSRYWYIFDSEGQVHEVSGDGVIGRQPLLKPGAVHRYSSACPLVTGIGYMKGHYVFQKSKNDKLFEVEIPTFLLEAPWLLN